MVEVYHLQCCCVDMLTCWREMSDVRRGGEAERKKGDEKADATGEGASRGCGCVCGWVALSVSGGSSERLTTTHFDFRKEPEQIMHDAQILCTPQAMTAFGAKRAGQGKSCSLGITRKTSLRANLGRSFCAALPLTLNNHSISAPPHPSSPGRHDNKPISPTSPSSTTCIFIDTSARRCGRRQQS